VQVPTTKTEPKKVAATVATFLKEDAPEAAENVFKRALPTDSLSVCEGFSHKNGIGKGSRYGDYLFERGQKNNI
jgi:hypothetical protein